MRSAYGWVQLKPLASSLLIEVVPSVHIGHGASLASGAVVVSDVPDCGIVGGNPATLIRNRFVDSDVARLLALAWWDRPVDHITDRVRIIMSGSGDELEAAAPPTS